MDGETYWGWLEVVDVGEEVLEEGEAVRTAGVGPQLVVTEKETGSKNNSSFCTSKYSTNALTHWLYSSKFDLKVNLAMTDTHNVRQTDADTQTGTISAKRQTLSIHLQFQIITPHTFMWS